MAHRGGLVASFADLWTKHKYDRTVSFCLSPMVTTPINGAPFIIISPAEEISQNSMIMTVNKQC